MRFSIVFLGLEAVLGFKIATRGGDKFMTDNGGQVLLSSSGSPLEFYMEEVSATNNLIRVENSQKVLDLKGGGSSVILWDKHGGWNQQFSLLREKDGAFYIMNSGKCMEVDTKGYLSTTACASKNEQKFELVTPTALGSSSAADQKLSEGSSARNNAPQIVIIQEKPSKHRSHSHFHGKYLDELL